MTPALPQEAHTRTCHQAQRNTRLPVVERQVRIIFYFTQSCFMQTALERPSSTSADRDRADMGTCTVQPNLDRMSPGKFHTQIGSFTYLMNAVAVDLQHVCLIQPIAVPWTTIVDHPQVRLPAVAAVYHWIATTSAHPPAGAMHAPCTHHDVPYASRA